MHFLNTAVHGETPVQQVTKHEWVNGAQEASH